MKIEISHLLEERDTLHQRKKSGLATVTATSRFATTRIAHTIGSS